MKSAIRTSRHNEAGSQGPTRSWFSSSAADDPGPGGLVGVGAGLGPTYGATRFRQRRLSAAALGLAVWWALILLQVMLAGPGWPAPAAMVLALGSLAAWLSWGPPIGPAGLRALEFALFGLVAGAFALLQYAGLRDAVSRQDATWFQLMLKDALIHSMTLMLAYAVLIPNTWRTAAPVVLGLAIYPLATTWALARAHPEALHFLGQEGASRTSGLTLSMTAVAAALSLYGIHVLSTLREEVVEARRLNQYQLGVAVGKGGMGEVYLAEHRLLKRTCAIKLILPGSQRDPVALGRFEREVRATARLSHPNIVEIYNYGRADDGTFFYVMEYLEGLNLAELVRLYGPQGAGRVIYLLAQACEGLAEAHAAGLVHRDLSPANLFVARVGRRHDVAKILDFGLVKDTALPSARRGRGDGVVGTLSFMAPEQRAGDPALDHRADLFALGAVAYYALTARVPFADADGFRPVAASPGRPVRPSSHRPGVPDDLERIILRCLEASPNDRYPDAEGLRAALMACTAAAEWGSDEAIAWWQEIAR